MTEIVTIATWLELIIWAIILATGLMVGFAFGWMMRDEKVETDEEAWIRVQAALDEMVKRETKR